MTDTPSSQQEPATIDPADPTRWLTEMGMGVDVHGGDYTKAGRRAVSDALRHSSLNFFEAAGKTKDQMHIEVRIGVQKPDEIDVAAIAEEVPYGTVTVIPVFGGLDVPGPIGTDLMIIANAAILVGFVD